MRSRPAQIDAMLDDSAGDALTIVPLKGDGSARTTTEAEGGPGLSLTS